VVFNADWPVPTKETAARLVQTCSAISCTSMARWIFSPMNCWISSTTSSVQGKLPFSPKICWMMSSVWLMVGRVLSGNWRGSQPGRWRRSVFWVGKDERLGKGHREFQAQDFAASSRFCCFQCIASTFAFQPGRPQPQDELGLGQVLGQAGGPQHQLNEREADVVHGARAERAGGCAQAAQRLAAVAQLREQIGDLRRQRDERACGGAVGEVGSLPRGSAAP
jgi:hypothetical protein